MSDPEKDRVRCPLTGGTVSGRLCREVRGFVDGEIPFSDEMGDFVNRADYAEACLACGRRGEQPGGEDG